MESLPLLARGEALDVSEEARLVRAAESDPAAFASLYRRYVAPIYRYLYWRLGHAADAEDVTAQVFTEALERLSGYRERGSFAAWLFTIARRRAADYYRRQRAHAALDEKALQRQSSGSDPLRDALRSESLQRLAQLVAGLDAEKQELLRLRFAGGLSYKEIAAVVGSSEAAVKMAVHRLLRRLRAAWNESDGGER